MWQELAEYARWAPSPHNTQPTRLHVVDDEHAELHFEVGRGLRVGDPLGRFTHVTFGMFAETLAIAAHAGGYELDVSYCGTPLYDGEAPRKKVADLRLRRVGPPIDDLDPALTMRRRTNRHPYNDLPVPQGVLRELREEARRFGHSFHATTDAAAIRAVKELNRDALYHDLAHADYRRELGTWLRYSEREARATRDGLSPRAMVLPGTLMRGVLKAHRLFSAPGLEQVTKHVYMKTMTGISTVAWIKGDFVSPRDWTAAGHLMMRLWLILTSHGVDWHPYGSVITNDDARRSMTDKLGISEGEGGRDMVWLLVRLGCSDHEPARSRRLDLAEVVG